MVGKTNKSKEKINKLFRNKIVLITGGSGSVGSSLTKILMKYPLKSIRVLDINEHSLFQLKRQLDDPKLRLLLGSILDKERLVMALNDVDIVIHLPCCHVLVYEVVLAVV